VVTPSDEFLAPAVRADGINVDAARVILRGKEDSRTTPRPQGAMQDTANRIAKLRHFQSLRFAEDRYKGCPFCLVLHLHVSVSFPSRIWDVSHGGVMGCARETAFEQIVGAGI